VAIALRPVFGYREVLMSMFFFDEADELEEYQTFRRQDQPR
jgi:hypothetical protein